MPDPTIQGGDLVRAPTRDPRAVVAYWTKELKSADEAERKWRKRAGGIVADFRGENAETAFNILASNVQTLLPALYSATPRPDVRRLFPDGTDPVGRTVSDLLERSIVYMVQTGGVDAALESAVLDHLLTGRGVLWVGYEPLLARTGAPPAPAEAMAAPLAETVVDQTVRVDCVYWDDFRLSPARSWAQVRWVARRMLLTRDELTGRFGAVGAKVPLDHDTLARDGERPDPEDPFRRAEIWQIWDKARRRVVHIAPGFPDAPVGDDDDPYGLEAFFPCPEPLYALRTTDTLVPVPEYESYRKAAEELDIVSERLRVLVDGMRVRGVYDRSAGPELGEVLKAEDNALKPADLKLLTERGGVTQAIQLLPIDTQAAVIAQLSARRRELVDLIYELTGISDILRGASVASETATAQSIKARYGGLRLTRRQMAVQRLVRDVFRLMAELVAEKFTPEVLSAMTGLSYPTLADQQAAQIRVRYLERMPAMADPAALEQARQMLAQPAWEDLLRVMRDDRLRSYRIEVETDSTIAEADAQDQQGLASMLSGVGAVLGSGLPADAVKALLTAVVRRSRLGRVVEDAVDSMPVAPPAPAPDPKAEAAAARIQAEFQVRQAELALKHQELELKRQELELKHQELLLKARMPQGRPAHPGSCPA